MSSGIPDRTNAEITSLYFLDINTFAWVFTWVGVIVAPIEPFGTGETTPSWLTITSPGIVIARPVLTARVWNTFCAVHAWDRKQFNKVVCNERGQTCEAEFAATLFGTSTPSVVSVATIGTDGCTTSYMISLLFWGKVDLRVEQNIPSQPSLQLQSRGSTQEPCWQPGSVEHLLQFSPSHLKHESL